MQVSKLFLLGIFASLLMMTSCKKEVTQNVVYDNIIYELDGQDLYQSNLEKNKEKTPQQYISILYSDLYNSAISSVQLAGLAELSASIGDKTMFNELVLSDWLATPGTDIPTDLEMRADLDQFIEDTYIKFYLRYPNSYEAYYIKSLIEEDADLTAEVIYTAFSTSNEYSFY